MLNNRTVGSYPLPSVDLETWLVRFDKNGVCSSPKTRDALLDNVAGKRDRPVLFFSHGWNNDFADAVNLYSRFLAEFEKVLHVYPITGPLPIFVGIIWPSIWLPSDTGPQMAAVQSYPKAAIAYEATVRELVDILPATTDWSRFYALLDAERISLAEAHELAGFLAAALPLGAREGAEEATASKENIVKSMTDIQRVERGPADDDIDAIGVVDQQKMDKNLAAAGVLDALDPRAAIRLASLYLMKDRAGKVGSSGVAALLRDLLQRTTAPIHAVGHSFGCKVLLSAVAVEPKPSRKLKSILLLQPAVSHLSFAMTVPGRDGPGGYRNVLERIESPIFSTFTALDFPLHSIYHLALLRRPDLGEAQIAAAGVTRAGAPPNAYAALGGYGPRGANQALIDPIPEPGGDFSYPKGARLVGLDGTLDGRINSHGGVANPYTAWALRKQMTP